jgi:hypothetical protein
MTISANGRLRDDVELVLGAEPDPRAAVTGLARLAGHDEVVAQPQLHVGEVALAVLVQGVALEGERVAEEVGGGATAAPRSCRAG